MEGGKIAVVANKAEVIAPLLKSSMTSSFKGPRSIVGADYPSALFRKDRADMNLLSGSHAGRSPRKFHRALGCIMSMHVGCDQDSPEKWLSRLS
jgi:hypothetical protein